MAAILTHIPIASTVCCHRLEIPVFDAVGAANRFGFVRNSPIRHSHLIQAKGGGDKRQNTPKRRFKKKPRHGAGA